RTRRVDDAPRSRERVSAIPRQVRHIPFAPWALRDESQLVCAIGPRRGVELERLAARGGMFGTYCPARADDLHLYASTFRLIVHVRAHAQPIRALAQHRRDLLRALGVGARLEHTNRKGSRLIRSLFQTDQE